MANNTDAPFGFKCLTPFQPQYIQYYPVVTANAAAIFRQDVVGAPADLLGLVCGALDGSTRPAMSIIETGIEGEVFGVVQGTYDSNNLAIVYLPATTTGDSVVAGYLAVNVDPNAFYLAQEDDSDAATPIPATSVGQNVDAKTTHAGNTLTGISKMEIDSSSEATTATLAFKLIRSWEADIVGAGYCRWVVKLNAAAMGANAAGPE